MILKIFKMTRHVISVPSGRIGLYFHLAVISICVIFKLSPDMFFDTAIRLDDLLAAIFSHMLGGWPKLWDFGFLSLAFLIVGMVLAGFLSYGVAIRSFTKHTA